MTQSPRRPSLSPGASRLDAYLRLRRLRDFGVILLVVVAGAATVAGAAYLQSSGAANWGFGPEWQCLWPGKGGPVCIKHPKSIDMPAASG
jgi:hypothetical protein